VKKLRAPAVFFAPIYISNPANVSLISLSSSSKDLTIGVGVGSVVGTKVGAGVKTLGVGVLEVGVLVAKAIGLGDGAAFPFWDP
jgi:hypothetical protein